MVNRMKTKGKGHGKGRDCKKSFKEIEAEIKIPKINNSYFNKVQLKKGIKIESEHSDNKKVAEIIAKQHLLENPNYYKKVKLGQGKEYLISKKK